MQIVSVSPPSIGIQAYFTFKEPVATYVRSKMNSQQLSHRFTVTSVVSIRESIELELRDPYVEVYGPLGILDYDYRKDVIENIPIYALKSTLPGGGSVYIKVPLNYIADYGTISEVLYTNRTIVLDLGKIPRDLSLAHCFDDLVDIVKTRTGITPAVKEVSIGEPDKISREEHEVRDTVRSNSVTVKKTNSMLLAEITHRYDQLLARLNTLGISLG